METYPTIGALVRAGGDVLGLGPIAVVLAEDGVEIASTLTHLAGLGFRRLLLLAAPEIEVADALPENVLRVGWSPARGETAHDAVNAVIGIGTGRWFYWGFNAEYLFYPFGEHRSVGELLAFHAEERRESMLTCLVDLYAGDLGRAPDGVSLPDAHFDGTGYFALARPDPDAPARPAERQYDFHGGLRRRFEEHVPVGRRRIDRIGLFRARPGLRLRADHTFDVAEMNTYACPWHHNLTAAICSFRAAKALRTNPGSRYEVDTFRWGGSVPFSWGAQQLLDLGLIEPGQWF